jgi:hypothetical protein
MTTDADNAARPAAAGPRPSPVEHLEIVHDAGTVIWARAGGRLDQPVRACPPWRIRDLVHHSALPLDGPQRRWADQLAASP